MKKLQGRDLIIGIIIGVLLSILFGGGIYSIHPVSEGTAAYRVNKFTGDVQFFAGNKNYIIDEKQ